MPDIGRKSITWVTVLLIAGLYFSLLPVDYNFDGTVFSQNLRYALVTGDIASVIQPHHLYYLPSAYGSYRLLNALFAYRVLEYFHLQLISLVFGLLLLFQVYRLMFRLCRDQRLALLAMTITAATAGVWYFSTSAEVHIPALFFLFCGVNRLLKPQTGLREAAFAAICFALAAGFHLTHLLMAAVGFLFLVIRGVRWKTVSVYSVVLLVCLAAPFILYSSLVDVDLTSRFSSQLFGEDVYAGYAISYWSPPTLRSVSASILSVTATLLHPVTQSARYAGLIITLVLLGIAWRKRGKPARTYGFFLLLWALVYLVFFTLWDSSNVEFKLPVMFSLLLLFFLAVHPTGNRDLRDGGLVLLLLLLFLVNYAGLIRPVNRIESNEPYQVAQRVGNLTSDRAIIVIAGIGSEISLYSKIYIPYFSRRQVWILDWMLGRGNDLPAVRRLINKAIEQGREVFLFSDLLESEQVSAYLQQTHGIEPGEWESFRRTGLDRPRIPLTETHYLIQL